MRQHAVFIGIDDYSFAPLESCVNDATAMRDLLISLNVFAPGQCTLLTSPASEGDKTPSRKVILDLLLPFYEANEPLDRLLVFYAGHGLAARLGRGTGELRSVLVPAGVARLRNSGDELIDLDELVDRFRRRGAREQYWITDACRNEPEGTLPNVAGIGWDAPLPNDPREAFEMAQGVLYAVGPLGQARSVRQGHGLLTSHLLDALARRGPAQWGSGGWYDDAADAWLFDLDSLKDYARQQIALTLHSTWEAEYHLPQCWNGERKPGPLLKVGTIEKRPFAVTVTPPEASSALAIMLKLNRHTIAAWPPKTNGETVPLVPGRYRVEALLADARAPWLPPKIPYPPLVDVRNVDRLDIAAQPREAGPRPVGAGPGLSAAPEIPPPSSTAVVEVPPKVTSGRYSPDSTRSTGPFQKNLETAETPPPSVFVKAIDPGVTLRLTRLTGGRDVRDERPNVPITLIEGVWRIEIRIGQDVIGIFEENLVAGRHYVVEASAQVTPALAALLPDPEDEAIRAAECPRTDLMPSETIGPMQGAILPTLLPVLALKPLDPDNKILRDFSPRLNIRTRQQRSPVPLLVALAFDGSWGDAELRGLATSAKVTAGLFAEPVWTDASARISLFAIDDIQRSDVVTLEIPTWGTTTAVVSKVENYATTATMTLWPDGRNDVIVSTFTLPPGADQIVRPTRLSRAMAIATRLYRGGGGPDDVEYDVFAMISTGSYGNPVLGAVAWFARARKLRGDVAITPQSRQDLNRRQGDIMTFLNGTVPRLGDTRVITTLSSPTPDDALNKLLDDPAMTNPILAEPLGILARRALARKQFDHWSVARFQGLDTHAVFNVTSRRTT